MKREGRLEEVGSWPLIRPFGPPSPRGEGPPDPQHGPNWSSNQGHHRGEDPFCGGETMGLV